MEDDKKLNEEDIAELAEFFDLLAKYDWEDKQKEREEKGSTASDNETSEV